VKYINKISQISNEIGRNRREIEGVNINYKLQARSETIILEIFILNLYLYIYIIETPDITENLTTII
jgi:hypothetical protein